MARKLPASLIAMLFTAAASAQAPDPDQFAKTFSRHTEMVNGVRLHHVIGGTGSPLTLLHGFLETWYA